MRLEIILRLLKRNFRYILLSSVVGGVLGILVFYFFPFGYNATGSLFVTRRPDLIQREDFTYEGYYAQQTASNYAKIIIGILEGPSVLSGVLEKQDLAVNEGNLRNMRRNIDVRKKAPQLVFIKVKSKNRNKARALWNVLTDELISVSNDLNKTEGDPNLAVQKVREPVVTEAYKDLAVFLVIGFLIGAFFSTFVIFGKSQVL